MTDVGFECRESRLQKFESSAKEKKFDHSPEEIVFALKTVYLGFSNMCSCLMATFHREVQEKCHNSRKDQIVGIYVCTTSVKIMTAVRLLY